MGSKDNLDLLLSQLPEDSLAAELVQVLREPDDDDGDARLQAVIERRKTAIAQELGESDED